MILIASTLPDAYICLLLFYFPIGILYNKTNRKDMSEESATQSTDTRNKFKTEICLLYFIKNNSINNSCKIKVNKYYTCFGLFANCPRQDRDVDKCYNGCHII